MSRRDPWHFQRWAFEVTVGNSVRKACLSFLAMTADAQTGRCEAKQGTIALAVEASDRTVREHLVELERRGFIARRAQFRVDRGRRGDEFLLLAPGIEAWPDGERVDVHLAGSSGGSTGESRGEAPAPSDTPPGVPEPPRKNDRLGTTSSEQDDDAGARARSAALNTLRKSPEWAAAIMRGADLACLALMEANRDVPWDEIAVEVLASKLDPSPRSLRTDSPRQALELRLADHRAGKRDHDGVGRRPAPRSADARLAETEAQIERFRAMEDAQPTPLADTPDASAIPDDGSWDDIEVVAAEIVPDDEDRP